MAVAPTVEVVVPLLSYLRSMTYLTDPATFSGAWWEWKASNVLPPAPLDADVRELMLGGEDGPAMLWRLTVFHGADNDLWMHDEPVHKNSRWDWLHPVKQELDAGSLPDFANPYAYVTASGATVQHGLGGGFTVASAGPAVPHTVPKAATNVRMRVKISWVPGDPGFEYYSRSDAYEDATTVLGGAGGGGTGSFVDGGTGWITVDSAFGDAYELQKDPDTGLSRADRGFEGDFWNFRAKDAVGPDGYRLRMQGIQMWMVYTKPRHIEPTIQAGPGAGQTRFHQGGRHGL